MVLHTFRETPYFSTFHDPAQGKGSDSRTLPSATARSPDALALAQVNSEDVDCVGNEALYRGDQCVGFTTSGTSPLASGVGRCTLRGRGSLQLRDAWSSRTPSKDRLG